MEMARTARDLGLEATIVVDDPGRGERDGIRFLTRDGLDLARISPGDAVIVSEAAAARVPFLLARAGIAFHADCYGLVPPELVQIYRSWSPTHRWIDRSRRNLRYQFLAHHAERIYLSHPGQLMLLAGMVYAGGQSGDPELVDALPRRTTMMPMGVSTFPPGEKANPYPQALHDRPVFLWGGGIWAWFDLDTLVRTFAEVQARGSEAALFFLSGKDHSGLEIHRDALERVRGQAAELGLLGRSVFLNERSAGKRELPEYLAHCRAGVMTNPDVLESLAAWRTRYLDLIAGGRPLVLSGSDPLGDLMTSSGAALRSPTGDHGALADSICRLAADQDLASRMGGASRSLAQRLSWSSTLAPLRSMLADPETFRTTRKPRWHWPVRYAFSPYGIRWP